MLYKVESLLWMTLIATEALWLKFMFTFHVVHLSGFHRSAYVMIMACRGSKLIETSSISHRYPLFIILMQTMP